jgi:hypothetical protein
MTTNQTPIRPALDVSRILGVFLPFIHAENDSFTLLAPNEVCKDYALKPSVQTDGFFHLWEAKP